MRRDSNLVKGLNSDFYIICEILSFAFNRQNKTADSKFGLNWNFGLNGTLG